MNYDINDFCINCSAELKSSSYTIICPVCGKEDNGINFFCVECNHELKKDEEKENLLIKDDDLSSVSSVNDDEFVSDISLADVELGEENLSDVELELEGYSTDSDSKDFISSGDGLNNYTYDSLFDNHYSDDVSRDDIAGLRTNQYNSASNMNVVILIIILFIGFFILGVILLIASL